MWKVNTNELAQSGCLHLSCYRGSSRLGFTDFVHAVIEEVAFREAFMNTLRTLPFCAFRWETPPVTNNNADRLFECIVHDSPELDVAANPNDFSPYFDTAKDAVSFPNLGADALLVVPCPQSPAANYAHLAAFHRTAPLAQQHGFWTAVGRAVLDRLNSRPLWLSTAGGGVDWLHARLDNAPKYYRYQAWKNVPAS